MRDYLRVIVVGDISVLLVGKNEFQSGLNEGPMVRNMTGNVEGAYAQPARRAIKYGA